MRLLLHVWWRLPYWVRRLAAKLTRRRDEPPAVHADRQYAACINPRVPRPSEANLAAHGFDACGKSENPLAEVQPWQLEHALDIPIKRWHLYRTALTATQALPSRLWRDRSFERTEFLGDAVALLTVRDLLLEMFPAADEGDMTLMQQRLVSGVYMYRLAMLLHLDRYIASDVLSMRNGSHLNPEILADAFEALLGAMYLDHGLEFTRRWLALRLRTAFNLQDKLQYVNWKSALLGFCGRFRLGKPQYELVSSHSYRDKRSGFRLTTVVMRVHVKGRSCGACVEAVDVRTAEHALARMALKSMGCVIELFSSEDLTNAFAAVQQQGPFAAVTRCAPLVRALASPQARPLVWDAEFG